MPKAVSELNVFLLLVMLPAYGTIERSRERVYAHRFKKRVSNSRGGEEFAGPVSKCSNMGRNLNRIL